ncbi:MAG TPA: MFS transporter [Paraburkholderia sp.]
MHPTQPANTATRHLYTMIVGLFIAYFAIAMSLSAVPIYVVNSMHLSNAYGGLAVGIAFLSTILTRGAAGLRADRLGGKASMQRGLLVYVLAGVVCLLAALPQWSTPLAYAILIAGRLLLGLGESLAIVGSLAWAMSLMGPARSGKAMALFGMAMYGSFAAGGPLGLVAMNHFGFMGLMGICIALPALGLILIHRVTPTEPHPGHRQSFWQVIGLIWKPGAAVGLQGVGFAALGAFFSLYFLARGWPHAGLGLTCFGAGFVLVRIGCGHLPDRIGGRPVAIASLAVEACGQYLLWLAPNPGIALVGAFMTGLGCSMVFPSMGLEAVKLVPPQLRATAIGGFAAFQDLAYGATGPVLGVLADHAGYAPVFLIGGVSATVGILMAVQTQRSPSRVQPNQ